MRLRKFCLFALTAIASLVIASGSLHQNVSLADEPQKIQHSYLVMGAKTAIIDESGKAVWEYSGGSRDGFVLPNGNVLLAFANRVEEVTRDKQVIFTYPLSPENKEIGTTQRLYNGNTLVTELGKTTAAP